MYTFCAQRVTSLGLGPVYIAGLSNVRHPAMELHWYSVHSPLEHCCQDQSVNFTLLRSKIHLFPIKRPEIPYVHIQQACFFSFDLYTLRVCKPMIYYSMNVLVSLIAQFYPPPFKNPFIFHKKDQKYHMYIQCVAGCFFLIYLRCFKSMYA